MDSVPPHPVASLTLPTRLLGRDGGVAALHEQFETVCSGEGALLLVPGAPGVGKTSLVHELEHAVREHNGLFCTGKFDQYHRQTPYFAIRQAMEDLLDHLQAEGEHEQQIWRQTICDAVGDLGSLLVDLTPKFEFFLGPQPPAPVINPQEARHRFDGVIRALFSVLCKPDHPLVLFIDDWQWADHASMELLRSLNIGSALRYVMVIAAFRDNEVDENHPFAAMVRELRLQGVPLRTLPVMPLQLHEVGEFVRETLQPGVWELVQFTEIAYAKTEGNPFFLHAFMRYVYEAGTIWLNPEDGLWHWNSDSTDVECYPDDVVTLYGRRLRQYPAWVRELIFHAACLGSRFDVETLAFVSGLEMEECLHQLTDETMRDMVLPATRADVRQQRSGYAVFRFVHDRVQQAAYGLVDASELPQRRLDIGRKLLSHPDASFVDRQLFEVVGHLNAGKELMGDPIERVAMVSLNCRAADKAMTATAYRAALRFHRMAGEFMQDSITSERVWAHSHDLAFGLHMAWAESEFLAGDQSHAEELIEIVQQHARGPVEFAEAQRVLIVQSTLLARYPQAIASGREGLKALNVHLPDSAFDAWRDRELGELRARLRDMDFSALASMPVMEDAAMAKAVQLLITLGPPCYRGHQHLWSVLVPKVVNIILRHGNMPEVGYSHTALAGLLIWTDDDFDTARGFMELAETLMTRTFTGSSEGSVFYLMIGSSARHWFHHLSRCSQDYESAYEIGSRSGNLQYAAYAFGHNMYCRFFQGTQLGVLRREIQSSLAFSRSRFNQWAIDLLEGGAHVVDCLTGALHNDEARAGWEREFMAALQGHHNVQVACVFHVLKSFLLLVEGEYAQALEHSHAAQQIIHTVGLQGLLPWPEHLLIRFVLLSAVHAQCDAKARSENRTEMDGALTRMQVWARRCPENYAFKLALMEAEYAAMDGVVHRAVERYEAAIDLAQKGGFMQWQAVANERCAVVLESQGLAPLAQIYWQQAYASYELWGAEGKVLKMEKRFRQELENALPDMPGEEAPVQAIRASLLAKQMELYRSRELRDAEQQKRLYAERQSRDLAEATARLREEVAQRKKMERHLKVANEQALAASRSKSIFLANMSHEIRTPLNGVIGMLQLMQSSGLTDDLAVYAKTALASSRRLTGLLSDILDLSRVEAGRLELAEATFGLHDALATIETLFGPVARQKGLELIMTVDATAPSLLCGDSLRLQQVLSNFVGNAIKFTDTGYVELEVTRLPYSRQNESRILFTVSDTGIGIPDGIQERLFESFAQAETDYKRRFQGAGLGLAISRELVFLMGGSIHMVSEVGRGTQFCISVPFKSAQAGQSLASDVAESRATSRYRILLVEDDAVSQMVMGRMLNLSGHDVHTVGNGREALAALEGAAFDAVLMDVQMPVMDGLEATRAIRRGQAGALAQEVPIIAVTAYAMAGDKERFLAAGMDAYVSKPVDMEALHAALETLLRDVHSRRH